LNTENGYIYRRLKLVRHYLYSALTVYKNGNRHGDCEKYMALALKEARVILKTLKIEEQNYESF